MPLSPTFNVKKGYSCNQEQQKAIEELHSQIYQPNAVLTLIFVSSCYQLPLLAPLIRDLFGDNVIGCTTAGEITAAGYKNGTLSGFSISGSFHSFPFLISDLENFNKSQIDDISLKVTTVLQELKAQGNSLFALSLIDGLSKMEEQFSASLSEKFKEIPIVGGSAGDDQKYSATHIYFKGKFQTNCALVCFCATVVPFKVIKSQHFISTEKRLLVTKADPDLRTVFEINGNRASEEYAKVLGIPLSELDVTHFLYNPLLLRKNEKYFVHSIQKVNDDGSLTFFSAIDEGIILRIAAKTDIVENLKNSLSRARSELGDIILTIGFECILRKLEIADSGNVHAIEQILQSFNTVGFCTYGEQYNGSHVNQTFTAILFGKI